MWVALLALLHPARAEWRAALGGEINADPHGVLDLGWRREALSVQLLTDTLDLRWSPTYARGRSWLALRAEGGAAGLLISPWTDGAPDPDRALMASYGGVQAGRVRYLERGAYAGVEIDARLYDLVAFEMPTDEEGATGVQREAGLGASVDFKKADWRKADLNKAHGAPWFAELQGGVAPGLARADGLLPVSLWFLVGRDWGA